MYVTRSANFHKESDMLKGLVLWLLGVPFGIIVLLWLFGVLH